MNAWLDIGQRTQPPEPDVSQENLDALRRMWEAEVDEDIDIVWVSRRCMRDSDFDSTIKQIAVHILQDEPEAAVLMAQTIKEREVERKEREYFS